MMSAPKSAISTPKTPSNYMQHALSLARCSSPLPTNFRVGALLIDSRTSTILATGYTLELPGNTHAEQVCLQKYAVLHNLPEERVCDILPEGCVIYTTMEPCVERLSGNLSCVERILRASRRKGGGRAIERVYCGVGEPEDFVRGNSASARLWEAGIQCIYLEGFEEEALEVARVGHKKDKGN